MRDPSERRGALAPAMLIWLALGAAVVLAAALLLLGGDDKPARDFATAEALRGPMTINVVESGTILPKNKTVLRVEVETRSINILSIVPEGTIITEEDAVPPDAELSPEELATKKVLVELDSTELEEELEDLKVTVANTRSTWEQAVSKLEVTRNQAQSDIETAELELKLAELDEKKYLEGEYPNEQASVESNITIAKQELEQAKDTLEWSKRLEAKGFITPNELESDRLSYERKKIALQQAENAKKLLAYTYQRQTAQLTNAVKQARRALERIKTKAKADIAGAVADERTAKREYDKHLEDIEQTQREIRHCRIYAPVPGRVMYAESTSSRRWHSNEPLGEGSSVYYRQELIHLSNENHMMAEVKVHETMRARVKPGMPVKVQSVELPGMVFTGYVTEIADSPDQAMWWMNPDLKVYNTKIELDPTKVKLRSGMSCQVEIIIDKLDDVISVPLQCLVRLEGKPMVYLPGTGQPEPRPVEVGPDNNRRVQIVRGLAAGEKVLLNPPLPASAVGRAPRGMTPEPEHNHKTAQKPSPKPGDSNGKLTDAMKERLKKMTPEQRKALRDTFQKAREKSQRG